MPVAIPRIPLIKVGEWPVGRSDGKGGRTPVTHQQLLDAMKHYASGTFPQPVGGLAHVPGQEPKNGESGLPALGHVTAAVVEPDENGVETLFVDMDDVPEWVANGYPRRSAEWFQTSTGEIIVHKVGFMGDDYPAIDRNMDVNARHALAEAMTTDAGPAPLLLAAGAVLCTAAFDTPPAAAPAAQNKPSPNGPESTDKKEPTMDVELKLVARSLGLPEDSTVETINAKLAEAPDKAKADADAAAAAQAEADRKAAAEAEAAKQADATKVAAASAQTVTVQKDVWEATVAGADAGREALAKLAKQEAEAIVVKAAADEKIPDTDDAKAAFISDLTEKGETTRAQTLTLLTAAADQGGFVPGRTSIPTGGFAGHSITAAATGGGMSDADFYKATYGEEMS